MKQNKNKEDINFKNLFLGSLAIGVIFAVITVMCALNNSPHGTLQDINSQLPQIAIFVAIFLVLIVSFFLIMLAFIRFIDSNTMKTTVKRKIEKISTDMQTRNCKYIYNCIHLFLFDVLRTKNELFKLSVDDMSDLVSKGYSINTRKECTFYRFEVTTPPCKLEFDCATYKSMLNAFIARELYQYGIQGLTGGYNNSPSIFIDRLTHSSRTLAIDVLYIDNSKAYKYYQEALERDKRDLKNEDAIKRLLKILSRN